MEISWKHTVSEVLGDSRGGSRAAALSKMEHFVIIVNSFQPLIIITKRSILDVASVLDLPLDFGETMHFHKIFAPGN